MTAWQEGGRAGGGGLWGGQHARNGRDGTAVVYIPADVILFENKVRVKLTRVTMLGEDTGNDREGF